MMTGFEQSYHESARPFSSKRGGVFRTALLLAVFILAAATLSWMLFLPYAVSSSLRTATGYNVDIGTLSCNPLGFDLTAENVEFRSGGSEAWLSLEKLEATSGSPFMVRRREFETLHLDAKVIRLETDERGLFNVAKLTSGLQTLLGKRIGSIEVKKVTLEVDLLEIADFSGPVPKRQTVKMNFKKGPYPAHSFLEIFQPLLEEAAKHGFRPL